MFVHGESLKSCVVGIVIPDVDVVKCWAVENGIPGTLSVLCANPQVKQLIMDDMLSWGKEAGLKSFEQVRRIKSFRCIIIQRKILFVLFILSNHLYMLFVINNIEKKENHKIRLILLVLLTIEKTF